MPYECPSFRHKGWMNCVQNNWVFALFTYCLIGGVVVRIRRSHRRGPVPGQGKLLSKQTEATNSVTLNA